MTNKQFLQSIVDGTQTASRSFQNLYFDGRIAYSYGTHYPLMQKFQNTWLIHDQGYSSTTGRHISHTKAATNYNFMPVHSSSADPVQIIKDTQKHIKNLNSNLAMCTPRSTRKISNLKHEIERYTETLDFMLA